MARNGSGVMVRTDGTRTGSDVWVQARNASVKITASGQDSHDQDIANEISNSIAADGQTTITANIPMNSKKFTGLGAGTARTDSVRVAEVQDGTYTWDATDTGAADAYAIQLAPAITAYAAGQEFRFIAANANTGASTLAVNGLAAKAIKRPDGSTALSAGDIAAGSAVTVLYDGTNFRLVSCVIGSATQAAARKTLGLATTDSPTFTGATFSGLTASKFVKTDGSKVLVSGDAAATGNNSDITQLSGLTNGITTYAAAAAFTPNPTAQGGGSITAVTNGGNYFTIGTMVFFSAYIGWSGGSGTIQSIQITLPTQVSASLNFGGGCYVTDNGAGKSGSWAAAANGTTALVRLNGAAFTAAAGDAYVTGWYIAA